jgi:hypothetical protein
MQDGSNGHTPCLPTNGSGRILADNKNAGMVVEKPHWLRG